MRTSVGVLLLLAVLVVAIWLPFGIQYPGVHEPWLVAASFDSGQPLILWPLQPRVFMNAFWWFAFYVTPGSFIGAHLFIMLGFWAKGAMLFLVVRRLLPNSLPLGAAAGALVIVYPADTGLLLMKAGTHHLALALWLLAVWLLLRLWEQPTLLTGIAMLFALLVSGGIYETGLPLMLLTPLLLVWLERRISRRVILYSLLWWIVPLFWLVQIALLLMGDSSGSYVGVVTQTGLQTADLPGAILSSLVRLYTFHLRTGWRNSLAHLTTAPLPLLAISGGVLVLMLAAFWRWSAHMQRHFRRDIALILTGLVLIALGFMMYLPTELRDTTDRTFFYSAVGGALVMVALCSLVAFGRLRRVLFSLAVSGLIALGLLNALVQHQEQYDLSYSQQRVIAGVIAHAPRVPPGTFFLLVADTPAPDLSLDSSYLSGAFSFLYQDYPAEMVSNVNAKACLYSPMGDLNGWITCTLSDSGVVMRDKIYPSNTVTIPYERVAAFRLTSEGAVEPLDPLPEFFPAAPGAPITPDVPPPPRAATVLAAWPP